MRKEEELKELGLLDEGEKVADLFEENEMVKALAGEIYMEVPLFKNSRRSASLPAGDHCGEADGRKITDKEVKEIEVVLQDVCGSITEHWEKRMVQSPLAKATSEALGKPLEQEEHSLMLTKMGTLLQNVLNQLPEHLQERYDFAMLLGGYSSFMEGYQKLSPMFELHEVYLLWHKKHVVKEDAEDCNVEFSDLFECLQVRSSSEAFCETIGSIMKNHTGKGRYLRPVNFNKEIFLGLVLFLLSLTHIPQRLT